MLNIKQIKLSNISFFILLILNCVYTQHGGHDMPSVSSYENCKMVKGFAKMEWTITPNNVSMNIEFEQGGFGWSGIGFNKRDIGMNNASIIIASGDCDINACQVYEYIGKSNSKPINIERKLIYGKVKTEKNNLNLNFIKLNEFKTIKLKNETISILLAFNNQTKPHGPNHHLMKHQRSILFNLNLFLKSKCHQHSNHDSMSMMKMYFHFDLKNVLLLPFLKTNSIFDNLLVNFILLLVSILNQFFFFIVRMKPNNIFKVSKDGNVQSHHHNQNDEQEDHYEIENENLISFDEKMNDKFQISKYWWYLIKPIVLFFQSTLSYLLMLIIMTYNIGFFISIVFGNALGWALFNMRSNIEPQQCCQ
eukprot:gene9880-2202_t